MNTEDLTNMDWHVQVIEAALFAAAQPLSLKALKQLLADEAQPPNIEEIKAYVDRLRIFYDGRGIALKEVASGYRFQVKENLASYLQPLLAKKLPRYSAAFLETLALIVYRQPISRGEIEQIRGVPVRSDIMRKLLSYNWVRVVGRKNVPGKPALFGSTQQFLDDCNLKGLDDLPPLKDMVDVTNFEKAVKEPQLDLIGELEQT